MSFVSVPFAILFFLLIVSLKLTNRENTRQWILLIASYLFYVYWDFRYLGLLMLQTGIVYITGIHIEKNREKQKSGKAGFVTGMILCTAVLGVLKYYNFFVETFQAAFGIRQTWSLNIILPVGISFYTFQALSYIIDVYQKKQRAEYSFWKIALYIGFFPQITSGPIMKAHDFLPQLNEEHKITGENLAVGAQIFLMGVVKKIVIADRIALAVDTVYATPNAYSGLSILCAVLGYSVQIYCDFSGYSDMAIGIARMLGYHLGKNFNVPYLARNLSDFWGRWHISLSSWFMEYVYFPLGGNRKGKLRTYWNVLVVMLLSGIWHGADWTFVLWGAVHGLGSIVHKLFSEMVRKKEWYIKSKWGGVLSRAASIGLTYMFVTLSWILFRADDFATAWTIFERLFTWADGVEYVYIFTIVYAVLVFVAHLYVQVFQNREAKNIILDLDKFSSWFIIWVVILLTLMFFYSGDTAFIYAQF